MTTPPITPGRGRDQHRMVGHRTLARRAARFSHRRAVTSRVRWSANGPRCQLPGTVRTEIPSGAGRSGFLCRITTARPGNACNARATLTADSGSRIASGSGCAKAHPGATCRSQTWLAVRCARSPRSRTRGRARARRAPTPATTAPERPTSATAAPNRIPAIDHPSPSDPGAAADTVVARGDQAIEGRGPRIALAVFEAGPVHDEPRAPEVAHGPSQLMAPLEQLLPLHAPRWAHQHPQ